jgi:sugar O-acyltransferase (sialic acid O-acetyltransferase NeuD family)
MKKRLAIIGSGELGRQIAHLAMLTGEYVVAGYFDDFRNAGETEHGLPVLGKTCDIKEVFSNNVFDGLTVGIGYKNFIVRKRMFDVFSFDIPFFNVISKYSYIDGTAKLGNGVVVYPGVIIDKDVKIEDNVLLNLGVCVAHNCRIGHSSFISPRVAISGFSDIGERGFLGINSTVIDNIKICADSVVGAASSVIKDITEPGLYVGCPAKKIKDAYTIQ